MGSRGQLARVLLRTTTSYAPAALAQAGALQLAANGMQRLGLGLGSSAVAPSPLPFNPFRTFASQKTPSPKVKVAADMLQQANMLKLRDELDVEAEQNLHIGLDKFTQMAINSGVANNSAEATEVLNVLHKAGVVLHHHDLVYLRAEEIAEMVMLMLPGGKESAQQKLQKVENELADLDKVHDDLEKKSRSVANMFLWSGLFILTGQFLGFIWLTWWELSWDVMEPFGYIISLFYSIVAYTYFLFTRDTFDLGPFAKYWSSRLKKRKIQEMQFDVDRWNYLRRLRDRYKRHLAHVPRL